MFSELNEKTGAVKIASYSLVLMFYVLVVRESAYIFAPESGSLNPIDFVLFSASVPMIVFGIYSSEISIRVFILFLTTFTFISGFISSTQLAGKLDFLATTKLLFPIVILILSLDSKIQFNSRQRKLVYFAMSLLIAVSLMRTFANQSSSSVLETRHSTAYLITGLIIVLLLMKSQIVIKWLLVIALTIPLMVLNVTSAVIGLIVFISLQLANHFRLGGTSRGLLIVAGIVAAVFSRVDVFTVKSSEIRLLGSGRVGAWEDAVNYFWQQDVYTQIFGQGNGSSFQFWGVWWWAQKDIHSDLLRILIENGLIVFLTLFACFIFLYLRLQKENIAKASILASALVTAVISNGVLGRPYASVLWAIAAIVATKSRERQVDLRDDEVLEPRAPQKVQHRW